MNKSNRPRVTINTDPMPATPSPRRSPSSSVGARTPRSPRTPRGSKLPGKSDSPRKIRNARDMARLRKIAASPCEMRTPSGPQLSPRKVFVPHVAMGGLSLSAGRGNSKSGRSPRRAMAAAAAQPWSPPIASPGTRKYLEISYAAEAAKIDALDNGEQHLLRALLVENTATNPAQLYKACEYYEKSILIRDNDAKVARRMYNYASFCLLRLGNAKKAEKLLRSALELGGDPEISLGLAQCLYLREKPRLIRIQKSKLAGAGGAGRDNISDDGEGDQDGASFPASLQSVVDEAAELFDEAVDNYDEEVAVILEAGEFFRDTGNIERAQELFEMAKELDMGDDMVDSDDDSDEEQEEQEDPMSFTLRRKKLSGPEVKFRCALFARDSLGDVPAALEVLEDLFGRNNKDLDLIVALADTLRIAWEKTDLSERNPGLEDESLQRAANLCVRGHKIHEQKSSAYWSLGLILRCRGTPPLPENEDDDDDDDAGSGRRKGRKKGGRKKKKKKKRRSKRRGQAQEDTPAELRHKGLRMLLKAVQLESHVPVAEHLLYVAQILASDAEEQKQAEMTATLAAAAKAAVTSSSSSKQPNQKKGSPPPPPSSLPNTNNERIELAKSFYEQAVAVDPSDPSIAQAFADFLINQLNCASDDDTASQPFEHKAVQAMVQRAADLLESAAASDMENLSLQNKVVDFLESKSMFRRADKIMRRVTHSMLKKKQPDDDADDKEEEEDEEEGDADEDEPDENNELNAAQRSLIQRYAVFLISRRFQFARAHALLAALGTDSIDDDLKGIVLAIYDQVLEKRANIVRKQRVPGSDPPAADKAAGKKKGKKGEPEDDDVLPIDRVRGTVLLSRMHFLRDVVKETDAAIEFVEEQLLPYATRLQKEVVTATATATAAAAAVAAEEDSSDDGSTLPPNPVIAKYLEMMMQIARLYAGVENHDAAFTHLTGAVTNAGYADVRMLSTPLAEGGFLEVGESVGEKQWSPLLENVKANAAAEKARVRAAKKAAKLRKKK